MTKEKKQEKILASIAARGYCGMNAFYNEGVELQKAGKIKRELRMFIGGNRDAVWVAA